MHLRTRCNTEKRVKRQLVEAILFEQLLPFEIVEEQEARPDSLFILFGSKHTFQCRGKQTAFNRFRIKEDTIILQVVDGSNNKATIKELVHEVTLNEKKRKSLLYELEQTMHLSDWNLTNLTLPLSRRELAYEELECALVEGHPYHPCFKARTGFTLKDHQAYGPEAKNSFQLWWLGVRRGEICTVYPKNEKEFWVEELGEETFTFLLQCIEGQGGSYEDYTLFPVHPWQWENLMNRKYLMTLQEGAVLPLGKAGDYYRATQSVRTLWNETDLSKAHIKLPMNIVNTSTLRTLEAHSVCSAPAISRWLERVRDSDSFLQEKMVLLKEYAGAVFAESNPEFCGNLAFIWRESVRGVMKTGEEAVPFNALSLVEQDGLPFIDSWVKKFGLEKWLRQLMEVSIIPVWHLLVGHGIAVEAHAQNLILLHKDGWPSRIVVRDFHESVEYTEGFLKDPSLLPNFKELHSIYKNAQTDRFYWMSSVESLRELVMDTLFVFHLSDLSFLLAETYSYSEELFWRIVREAISNHLSAYPELIDRHIQLQAENSKILVESLFTKKINSKREEYHHLVTNSLFMEKEL